MPDPTPAAQPSSEAAPGGQTTPPAPAAPTGDAGKPAGDQPASTPASKPTEETKPEPKPGETPGDKPLELKLPENSPLDPARVDAIAALAKERGLSQEAAQEILNSESAAVASYVEKQEAVLAQRKAEWVEELKKDPNIGGEKFAENAELSKRVLATFGDDDLSKALIDTGLGNYPPLVRFMNKVGRAMAEDRLVTPGAAAPGPKDDRDIFYGKTS